MAEQPGVEDVGGEHGHAGIAEELHAGLVVALIAGVILLVNTDGSVGFLTAVLAIYFIIAGLVKVTVAATNRGQSGAGWIAVNGILSLIIGLIIIADISNTKDWAIGLLLGIDFIFAGFTLLMIGTRAKQLSQEP